MKVLFFASLVFFLTACQSEIDKCVEVGVKNYEPYKNSQEKTTTEYGVRMACLKAYSGK